MGSESSSQTGSAIIVLVSPRPKFPMKWSNRANSVVALQVLYHFSKTDLIPLVWQVNGVVRSWSQPAADSGIDQEHGQNKPKALPVLDKDGNNWATSIITGMGSQQNWRNFKMAWGFFSVISLGP